MDTNRRDFLKGCCAAGLGAGAGRAMAFFDPFMTTGGKAAGNNVLVYIFLRGAIVCFSRSRKSTPRRRASTAAPDWAFRSASNWSKPWAA